MVYSCTTISLRHLTSDAWFILNNARYASPDVIMRACVCVCKCICFNMCTRKCIYLCVFPTMWEADSRSCLSAQQGCYGNDRGANRGNKDALNCCEVTLKKQEQPHLQVKMHKMQRCSSHPQSQSYLKRWKLLLWAIQPTMHCNKCFSCLSRYRVHTWTSLKCSRDKSNLLFVGSYSDITNRWFL